jgi:hypothetical protein
MSSLFISLTFISAYLQDSLGLSVAVVAAAGPWLFSSTLSIISA